MQLNKIAIYNNNAEINFSEKHLQTLAATLPGGEVVLCQSVPDLYDRAFDADALILWPMRMDGLDRYFSEAPRLKWVHTFTVGVDGLMNTPLAKRNLITTCTKGIHGGPIADHVLALSLAMLRCLPTAFVNQKQRIWRKLPSTAYRELNDTTMGIIGCGMIGQQVARKARLAGMRVIGADIVPIVCEDIQEFYLMSRLDEMLAQCDIVTLNCPLTDSTRHLFNADRLQAMRPSAFLINVARGGIVDDAALLDALTNGTIAGAALDTVTPEPLPEDSLYWDLPNVILTPHIAAYSAHYMDRATAIICENIQLLSQSMSPKFQVNLDQ